MTCAVAVDIVAETLCSLDSTAISAEHLLTIIFEQPPEALESSDDRELLALDSQLLDPSVM